MQNNGKEIVMTGDAPAPIGPYSQATKIVMGEGGFVFASGQIPLHPVTGEIPQGIETQTRQALDNVKAVLTEAGSSLDRVMKTTVFLKDMDDFGVMNSIYGEYFGTEGCPARSAVEVARLPKDVLVEIEVIALL